MCDPILVTLLKMGPHDSQSSRENVTPFSGTSPLASYNKVPSLPPGQAVYEKLKQKTVNHRVSIAQLRVVSPFRLGNNTALTHYRSVKGWLSRFM